MIYSQVVPNYNEWYVISINGREKTARCIFAGEHESQFECITGTIHTIKDPNLVLDTTTSPSLPIIAVGYLIGTCNSIDSTIGYPLTKIIFGLVVLGLAVLTMSV